MTLLKNFNFLYKQLIKIRPKRQNAVFSKFSRLWLIVTIIITTAILLFLNIFPRYHTSRHVYMPLKLKSHVDYENSIDDHYIGPTESNEFASSNEHCETIHIGIVCAGYRQNLFLHTLLKSIYFHRVNPIHFHLIVNSISEKVLSTLFESWNVPKVNVTFYDLTNIVSEVRWVPNSHYSGLFGLLKLLYPKIIPLSVTKKILVLDSDVIVVSNLLELWKLFNNFNKTQAIGIVENQSDYYLGYSWPVIGTGYNSGVLLYNLQRLKEINWPKLWSNITKRVVSEFGTPKLGDQDVINAVIKEHPEILYEVPCYWNTQLSDHTTSSSCYKNHKINILHWNSPKKLNVINKDGDYFRSIYSTYVEYNGNLLRQLLQQCGDSTIPIDSNSDNLCSKFSKPVPYRWRTLLFFMDYKSTPVDHDITFVAQLSFDRLLTIEDLVKSWLGPISLTLYVSDPELDQAINFIQNSDILKLRKDVAYHAVFKDGDYYPINKLRNVGLKNVNTSYVFLADVDFVPMKHLYRNVRDYISKMGSQRNKALIIPAFESLYYGGKIPKTKKELLRMWNSNLVRPFRDNIWMPGHAPTNYEKWKTATSPYQVTWQPDFEPYIIVRSDVVGYDERFIGFGWNKVSHIMELEAQNYQFIVLPDTFIVHKPHAPSHDIERFRTSSEYRICLQILKEEFIQKINKQYDKSFVYKNTSIPFEMRRRKREFEYIANTTEETNTDYPFLT